MKYVFASKRDEGYVRTYLTNYKALGIAIEAAGGAWNRIVPKFEELLDLLARNSIQIQAKYEKDNEQ